VFPNAFGARCSAGFDLLVECTSAAACLAKPFRGTALLDIVRAVTRAAGTH